MPSGHKAFLVHNPADVDLLLMHNKTFAAEYVFLYRATASAIDILLLQRQADHLLRISHAVSSRKRVDIVAKAKQLGVKVTNAKARVTTEA